MVLAVATAGLVTVSCTNQPSGDGSDTSPSTQTSTTSSGGAILGVPAPHGAPPAECAEPIVARKKNVPTAELTVLGREGDQFAYEITKKDGSRVSGQSGVFTAGQTDVIFTTGVPNSQIQLVTITAQGHDGETGKCAITTIK